MGSMQDFESRLADIARRHPEVPVRAVTLVKLISHAQQRIEAQLALMLQSHGLSHSGWRLLIMIYSSPSRSISPSAASETLNQSRAHMTRLGDELVAEGWVERIVQTGDRRSIEVRLTAAGEQRVRALLPAVSAAYEQLLAGFTESEAQRLERLMRRWVEHLELGTLVGATTQQTGESAT